VITRREGAPAPVAPERLRYCETRGSTVDVIPVHGRPQGLVATDLIDGAGLEAGELYRVDEENEVPLLGALYDAEVKEEHEIGEDGGNVLVL
jgi:hypothetical protein